MEGIEVQETEAVEIELSPERKKTVRYPDGGYLELGENIGKGSFSKVKQGTEFAPDPATFAVKIMHKGVLKRQRCVFYDNQNMMQMTNNLEKVLDQHLTATAPPEHSNFALDNQRPLPRVHLSGHRLQPIGSDNERNMTEQRYDLNLQIFEALLIFTISQ